MVEHLPLLAVASMHSEIVFIVQNLHCLTHFYSRLALHLLQGVRTFKPILVEKRLIQDVVHHLTQKKKCHVNVYFCGVFHL